MKALLGAICALLLSGTIAIAANPQVDLKTNLGTITVELYPDKAPQTVKNFLEYVQAISTRPRYSIASSPDS